MEATAAPKSNVAPDQEEALDAMTQRPASRVDGNPTTGAERAAR
jgi:hypothetical protein